jgi:molybdopterin-guanine dinucleotide biosynthesis protein A
MGGRPKGRLVAGDSGETLVERLVRVGREAGLEPVLVGPAEAYRDLVPEVPRLPDRPPEVGPLGGLSALLAHAPDALVVAVACDMPAVTADHLRALLAYPAPEPVVAAQKAPGAPLEPFFARYDPARVQPAVQAGIEAGVRSFQALFERVPVCVLDAPSNPAIAAALVDWDTPRDLP